MSDGERMRKIAELNDNLRTTFTGGRLLMTRGVQSLDERSRAQVIVAVQKFDVWTPENDPHGERDFGMVVVQSHHVMFKISYYDLDLNYLSADPADPEITRRVLTLMLAEEY